MTATQKQPRGASGRGPHSDYKLNRSMAYMHERGRSYAEIAFKFGITKQAAFRRVQRAHEREVRMAQLYIGGMTLRQIAERYGISKSLVWKALVRVGCSRRNPGTPIREAFFVNQVRRITPKPYVAPPTSYVWCGQCERKVMMAEADRCSSQFCKAKAVAA